MKTSHTSQLTSRPTWTRIANRVTRVYLLLTFVTLLSTLDFF